jgi:uncharacterized metal-binding protein (TIGR02443 family)
MPQVILTSFCTVPTSLAYNEQNTLMLDRVMSNKNRKRFIAGATCPTCKSLDTLMLYFENNVEKLACVKCDYKESQADTQVTSATRSTESVIGVFKP